MSQFVFLQPEWPDVYDATTKAESLAYPAPRTAWFFTHRVSLDELDARFASLQDSAFRGRTVILTQR